MKLFTLLLTIICVLGYAMYAEGRLGSPDEIQRRRLSTYSYGGTTYNAGGYKANPSRSAQIEARNAGALTNSEARSMGLKNYRDEMENDEFVGRPSYTQGNGRTYQSNGYTMNSRGYLANPSRSAQIQARNAGALTNSEARSMGLKNYRDEMENDEFVGWFEQNGKRYPGSGMGDEMDNDEFVGDPIKEYNKKFGSGMGDEMDNDEFVGGCGRKCQQNARDAFRKQLEEREAKLNAAGFDEADDEIVGSYKGDKKRAKRAWKKWKKLKDREAKIAEREQQLLNARLKAAAGFDETNDHQVGQQRQIPSWRL
jgi:hypothetical protein